MKLQEAEKIAEQLREELKNHFTRWEVCGSIRRQRDEVKDIDVVAIPKPESEYSFGEPSLIQHVTTLDPVEHKERKLGHKIMRFSYKNILVDLYLATEENFECLRLIRTGSAEHNIRLTTLARGKGLKLFASGKGLCKVRGGRYNNEPEEILEVVETTEDGILKYLLGRVPKPQERGL